MGRGLVRRESLPVTAGSYLAGGDTEAGGEAGVEAE
jgi:hypothetical protein